MCEWKLVNDQSGLLSDCCRWNGFRNGNKVANGVSRSRSCLSYVPAFGNAFLGQRRGYHFFLLAHQRRVSLLEMIVPCGFGGIDVELSDDISESGSIIFDFLWAEFIQRALHRD